LLIERLVHEQIPKKFGLSGSQITVLSPMNQGPLGVIALNQRLQQKLVPRLPGMPSVTVGNLEFRQGDRVCQRVNNYNLGTGVFNGDQGTISGIDSVGKRITVDLWDGRRIEYPSDTLYQLDLAYALTIHRSQGSEVPAVVLALHDSHNIMLERQLIYTGITRAKQLLVVVGTRKALAIAAKRSRSRRRFTHLNDRILALSAPLE
jgi:exodeoxyribonuclease V alpha subunit